MATKEKSTDTTSAPASPPWMAALDRARLTGAVLEAGDWVKFDAHGDHVCGRVVGTIEPSKKVKKGGLKIMLADGQMAALGLGGNLNNYNLPGLVGSVVSVWYVDDMEVGEQSPMKVYEVIHHGKEFPQWARDEAADKGLPF